MCFDDIQWGAETFVNLVESITLLSPDAPLLVVCMARPELLDRYPDWPVSLRLEPLPEQEARALVGDAMPEDVRQRIVRASGGNPLFLTEIAALTNDGDTAFEVPPTLRALLTARLDQLDEPERGVLERGAVEGELFHRGAVQALGPDEPEVTPRLAALVRRELVRPDQPQLPHEDAYRFRHLLIRDAAYDALPKALRAELHTRFADWLEMKQDLVESDELVGYHLEQAVRYCEDLGESRPDLALRAGERLVAAGRRALPREDEAAAGLLARALDLTRPLRLDVNLELDLAEALSGDPGRAAEVATQAAQRAAVAGDAAGEALARAAAYFYQGDPDEQSPPDRLEALSLRALSLLEPKEDFAGLAHVWNMLGFGVANARTRYDDWARAIEAANRYARLAGRPSLNIGTLWAALAHGSMPVEEALARLDQHDLPSPWWLLCRAWFLAMLDRFDEALPLSEKADADIKERGGSWVRRLGHGRDRVARRRPRDGNTAFGSSLRMADEPEIWMASSRPIRPCSAVSCVRWVATTRRRRRLGSAAIVVEEQDIGAAGAVAPGAGARRLSRGRTCPGGAAGARSRREVGGDGWTAGARRCAVRPR